MTCPQCGYAMSDFDAECPRCARMAKQSPQQAQPPATGRHATPPVVTRGKPPLWMVIGLVALGWLAYNTLFGLVINAGKSARLKRDGATASATTPQQPAMTQSAPPPSQPAEDMPSDPAHVLACLDAGYRVPDGDPMIADYVVTLDAMSRQFHTPSLQCADIVVAFREDIAANGAPDSHLSCMQTLLEMARHWPNEHMTRDTLVEVCASFATILENEVRNSR